MQSIDPISLSLEFSIFFTPLPVLHTLIHSEFKYFSILLAKGYPLFCLDLESPLEINIDALLLYMYVVGG